MKRRFFAIWAAALCLLAACTARTEVTQDSSSGVDTPPPTDAPPLKEPAEALIYAVDLETQQQSSQTEDGAGVLASCSFTLPVMRVFREGGASLTQAQTASEEEALQKAQTFNDEFAQWDIDSSFADLVETAQSGWEWYLESGYDWLPQGYTAELDCTVYRTDSLVSVACAYYTYTGGAHPNFYYGGWNFDLDSGNFFSPATLAKDGVAFQKAVTDEILLQIRQRCEEEGIQPEDLYWGDYESIAADWEHYAVTFDADGMNITFSPYDIAPYAAGAQAFTLPYDWLTPHLSESGLALLELSSPSVTDSTAPESSGEAG